MEQKNNLFENPEHITEWLCSTGYLFPRNEIELNRFDKLFFNIEIKDSTVSLDRIINNEVRKFPLSNIFKQENEQDVMDAFKMVARKGLEDLPDHIFNKMKKNQDNGNQSSPEETDK
ncbi:hypothetical protein [Sphingobacterium bovisgrunnientis]|uniref:hypothetical protein n=1 Tax=Sphingobacterium bovisgrunnientis TaxID=1874697 RepID=UPI001358690C|nr:hypothetical protein [Sphingobacterium bovisgrunnientis]